ncbi:MAG: DUF4174 domain-containing protein [Pseudomonadota bacterium]
MANQIDDWAWKYRPLIIVAPDDANEDLADQRDILSRLEPQLRDRDMVVIEVIGKRVVTVLGPDTKIGASALKEHIRTDGNGFELVLLGKDTGVKLRSDKPVRADRLFSLIDSMPMRRREMMRDS